MAYGLRRRPSRFQFWIKMARGKFEVTLKEGSLLLGQGCKSKIKKRPCNWLSFNRNSASTWSYVCDVCRKMSGKKQNVGCNQTVSKNSLKPTQRGIL